LELFSTSKYKINGSLPQIFYKKMKDFLEKDFIEITFAFYSISIFAYKIRLRKKTDLFNKNHSVVKLIIVPQLFTKISIL